MPWSVVYQGSWLETRCPSFYGGLVTYAHFAWRVPKLQTPRRKARVQHEPYYLYKQCKDSEPHLLVRGWWETSSTPAKDPPQRTAVSGLLGSHFPAHLLPIFACPVLPTVPSILYNSRRDFSSRTPRVTAAALRFRPTSFSQPAGGCTTVPAGSSGLTSRSSCSLFVHVELPSVPGVLPSLWPCPQQGPAQILSCIPASGNLPPPQSQEQPCVSSCNLSHIKQLPLCCSHPVASLTARVT